MATYLPKPRFSSLRQRRRVLLAWLEPLWPEVIRRLQEGQCVIEVRRD